MAARYLHVESGGTSLLKRLGDAAGIFQNLANGLITYYDVFTSSVRTLVTTDQSQTLTNKTLTTPVINGGTSVVRVQASDLSADGAIPIADADYVITKAGVCALTLAAPAVADEGKVVRVISFTANAHVVTFTGNTLMSGAAGVLTATFAAQPGAGITVRATGQKWALIGNTGVTIT